MRRALMVLSLALVLGLAASMAPADAQQMLTGRVWQVDRTDVYVTLADNTAVRVPAHTATFTVHGVPVDFRDLDIGTPVSVSYEPVYGYQHEYISSSSLDDVPVASTARWVWRDGRWERY